MRKITKIIVHCTATWPSNCIGITDIDRYHRSRGFDGVGYHFIVRIDGTIECGRPLERIGAHCRGQNACSIGVAYVGGLDASGKPTDTRTSEQRKALLLLLTKLRQRFPQAAIHSHRDFAATACPCFDATKEYAAL